MVERLIIENKKRIKDMKIKESQLRKIIRESLVEYASLNQENPLDIKFEKAKEMMGAESLLNEFYRAMSSDEVIKTLQYIDRVNGLGLFSGEGEGTELNEEKINPEDYMDDEDDGYNPRHQKKDKVEPRKMRKDKVN